MDVIQIRDALTELIDTAEGGALAGALTWHTHGEDNTLTISTSEGAYVLVITKAE